MPAKVQKVLMIEKKSANFSILKPFWIAASQEHALYCTQLFASFCNATARHIICSGHVFAAISTRRGKRCAGPVLPLGLWHCFHRASSFDSMIVVVWLHPGPCPFWSLMLNEMNALLFCAFVACLCFPPLFSYLFAPRFFCPSFFFAPRKKPRLVTLKG